MSLELSRARRPFVAFSDVHLFPDPRPHPGREPLLRFLGELGPAGPGDLWIAGDLFDFWHERGGRPPAGFNRVLDALAGITAAGWEVRFLPGNHDWWVGGAFCRATGASVLPDGPSAADSCGRRVLMAHGDGLGAGDWGYRLVLRPLLRSQAASLAFRALPGRAGDLLAGLASGTSRRILRRQVEVMPGHLCRWADRELEGGFGIVLTGHTHVASTRRTGAGIHISLGDWITSFTYASSDDEDGIRLRKYTA